MQASSIFFYKEFTLLIVFEGIDGCGKDTQIDMLESFLKNVTTKDIIVTSTLSSVELSKTIRRMLKGDAKYSHETLASIYTAEFNLVTTTIRNHLIQNKIVLCGRWNFSTIAYSGYSKRIINGIKLLDGSRLKPDLIVYLDIPVEESIKRISKRKGKPKEFFESKEYLEHAKESYEKQFANHKSVLKIDATLSKEEIHELIVKKLYKKTSKKISQTRFCI